MQSYSFGYVAQGLGINLRIMFLKSALFQVSRTVHFHISTFIPF